MRAAGTCLTGLFGAGPVIAAAVLGDVRHVPRFPNRDHFAAQDGTAPIEVSSGGHQIYRLPRRGHRRHGHAIHMTAVTQARCKHSPGRAYYKKKLAQGNTGKKALRRLKRHISDAIFACLQAGAKRAAAAAAKSPGRAPGGNHSAPSAARLTPRPPALRASHPRACHPPYGPATPAALPRSAAIPRKQANRSRTGRSPAAQRRRRRVLKGGRLRAANARGGKEHGPRARQPG